MNCKHGDENIEILWLLVSPNCANKSICNKNAAYVPAITVCNQQLYLNTATTKTTIYTIKSPTGELSSTLYDSDTKLKIIISIGNQDDTANYIYIFRNTEQSHKTATLLTIVSADTTIYLDDLSDGGFDTNFYYYLKAINTTTNQTSKYKYIGSILVEPEGSIELAPNPPSGFQLNSYLPGGILANWSPNEYGGSRIHIFDSSNDQVVADFDVSIGESGENFPAPPGTHQSYYAKIFNNTTSMYSEPYSNIEIDVMSLVSPLLRTGKLDWQSGEGAHPNESNSCWQYEFTDHYYYLLLDPLEAAFETNLVSVTYDLCTIVGGEYNETIQANITPGGNYQVALSSGFNDLEISLGYRMNVNNTQWGNVSATPITLYVPPAAPEYTTITVECLADGSFVRTSVEFTNVIYGREIYQDMEVDGIPLQVTGYDEVVEDTSSPDVQEVNMESFPITVSPLDSEYQYIFWHAPAGGGYSPSAKRITSGVVSEYVV